MSLIPLLIFSISCNLDNFVIGISYGVKNIAVNKKANIIIAIPTLLGTYISLNFGRKLFSLLPEHAASIISCGILIIIGLYMIIKASKKHNASCNDILIAQKYDADNNGIIDSKEAFALGIFLAINNIGIGVGFSTSSNNILLTSLITCLFSVLGFNFGNHFGKIYFKKIVCNYAELISGVLILLLGVIELFL